MEIESERNLSLPVGAGFQAKFDGVAKMLVCIESFLGDRLISGKKCSELELTQKMKKVINETNTEEFASLFCRMYQFEEYPFSNDVRVDFVIDLDTYRVHAPRY